MPSETLRFDVVISGASFGGLALACGLSHALGPDLKIGLIDRAVPSVAAPKADSRAFALSAASKRMLDVLGLWTLVADVAQPVTRIEITDSTLNTGVRPVLLTYDNVADAGEPATYIVPNSSLQAALLQRALGNSLLKFVAPAAASDFASDDYGIEVLLDGGGVLASSLLVAAEGRHSRLREAAGIKVVGWSYPQVGIVTTLRHDRPHGGCAIQHFLPAGPFAILPLTGNRSCITWTEGADNARRILGLNDLDFLAEVDKRIGGRFGALALDGPRQSWSLEMHLARRYVGPRFALIGDAAHGVHPIAGQGMNLAFRDVAALVEVLSESARLGFDAGDPQALARYERWRRFDSMISTATFDGLNRLFSSDRSLVRSGREFGLGLVDRMPMLKHFFVEEAAGLTGELPRLLKGEAV